MTVFHHVQQVALLFCKMRSIQPLPAVPIADLVPDFAFLLFRGCF